MCHLCRPIARTVLARAMLSPSVMSRIGMVSMLLLFGGACEDDAGHACLDHAEPSVATLGCPAAFALQAARPLDASLPGAMSIKTIVDRSDDDRVHFTDTNAYPLHRSFAVEHLGWPPDLDFSGQYLVPDRRFLLGAVTRYEDAGIWAYELAPYDTASPEMIADAFRLLREASYFGDELQFHPTSLEQEARAGELPDEIPIALTDEIWAGIDYQPLNLGETVGQLRVLTLDELEDGYVSPREIAVLDRVPNDISVVAGVVTEQFQTPLSHVNVLSQQRGTPNMGLHDAQALLAEHAGHWVRLTVGAFGWSAVDVTLEEADEWWEQHRPAPVELPAPDRSRTGLIDVDDIGLSDVAAVGGKAAHFGELRDIAEIVVPDGFAVPVHHYLEFMQQNGLEDAMDEMLADERFRSDGAYRRERLAALQASIEAAPIDPALLASVEARIADDLGGVRCRFRSSTNAEDLEGHSGAGLYTSESGEPGSAVRPIDGAIRRVWASLWNFRAFEERSYVGIDHHDVAMALLVQPAYLDEVANGVAITANVFDPGPTGEDAFYINAQRGETSVVQPDPGVVADQIMYFHFYAGQPATYYAHSSLVAPGETVLTRGALYELGGALDAIRRHFAAIYEPPPGYAALPMDVEWKLVADAEGTHVEIKQARPYPGRGTSED